MMDERERSLEEIFGRFETGGEGVPGRARVPYKFLDPYEAEDADIFFGREEEKRELFRKYFSSRFLLVYGESGTGKTSLLRCGLLTQVPASDLLLIHLKNSADPLEALEREVSEQSASGEASYGHIPSEVEALSRARSPLAVSPSPDDGAEQSQTQAHLAPQRFSTDPGGPQRRREDIHGEAPVFHENS